MDPKTRYKQEQLEGKQQRELSILEAAERSFIRKGIEKTTMQDIAREANIGIATLFRYFNKKEKLIVAVATQLLEPMLEHFRDVADLPEPCLSKIERLFDFFIDDLNNDSIKFMADFESYASHSQEPLEDILTFNSLDREILSQFSRIIQNGMEDGSIRADLPVEETLITVVNAFGLFSKKLSLKKNILLLETDLEPDQQLRTVKKIFMDYLRA